jgi:hypothetical protein
MDDRDGESHQIMFAADDLQERLERELGDAATAEDAHPLLRIARRMDSAGRMLGGHDAGSGTQKLQAEIVADLDRLIEQAKKACRSGQGGGQQTGGRPGGGPPRGAPAGNRSNDNRPQANSPRTTSHPPRKTDPAQVLELMKQVWGGLPPRLREQVMQLPAEEFMPKYESLIEDYFRGLAEERR